MDKPFAFPSTGFTPSYRSGVAARLAGLSVETLRVWERRYGVSDTQRSPHGQRLYSAEQVRKLSLLKQMVDQGHPIGTLITLSVEQLEQMSSGSAGGAYAPAHPIRLALVGDNLARRIANARREGLVLEVKRSCADLDDAAPALRDCGADVLLVELSELGDAAVPLILAARANAGVAAVVVLYRYCASATIRELRAHDCLVARVPAEMGELVLLCRAALAGRQPALPERPARLRARRFDDDALAAIAAIGAGGTRVACECPRHLAELLITVGSFERYSAQCASQHPADAELHRELEHAAAQARVLLEHAMERLARAEGLALPVTALRQTRDQAAL